MKKQVKQLAQTVASAHSVNTFTVDSSKDKTDLYSEIFERLIMCQKELTFSLKVIKNTEKGTLN